MFEDVGIDYKNELDLQSGMLFVKDKKLLEKRGVSIFTNSSLKKLIRKHRFN